MFTFLDQSWDVHPSLNLSQLEIALGQSWIISNIRASNFLTCWKSCHSSLVTNAIAPTSYLITEHGSDTFYLNKVFSTWTPAGTSMVESVHAWTLDAFLRASFMFSVGMLVPEYFLSRKYIWSGWILFCSKMRLSMAESNWISTSRSFSRAKYDF